MPPRGDGLAARIFLGPALRTQPDRRLVALVRSGYETAFEEIVRRYGDPLRRYAGSIVGGHAEDVTQDAFSKALLALRGDSKQEIELRPWLYRIVRNTALNDLRDNPPSPELLAEAIAVGANPAEQLERREELAGLMRRLQSLPSAQRAAIVMRELEGLSHEEIAAALGVSGGAARQSIHRARQALRNGLGILVPLPLLKLLLAGGTLGGAEAAAAGASGAAGAGAAVKAATATVLVAGAVGTGVVVQQERSDERDQASSAPATRTSSSAGAGSALANPVTEASEGSREEGGSEGPGSGEGESSEDRSGSNRGSDDDGDESESGHHRGRGPDGSDDDDADDRSGHGGNSGPGGSDDVAPLGSSTDGSSGPGGNSGPGGSSGSGSGAGSSGSGSGGSGTSDSGESALETAVDDSSGPGSGSDADDGSGSGPDGDDDEVEPDD